MTVIEIYSDGSATSNDKPGGYGWVMVVDGVKHSEGSGHVENVSNNDMELESAIRGLMAVLKFVNEYDRIHDQYVNAHEVTLVSDSQIILGWASGAYRFKQLKKIDKYKQLQFLVKRLGVKTRWVKGHSGDEHNERCDKLANHARKGTKEVDKAGNVPETMIGSKKNGVVALWYGSTLKIVDLEKNIVENYNRDAHGKRGTLIQIREEKSR